MKRIILLSSLLATSLFAQMTVREILLNSAPGQRSEAAPAGVPSNWSWVAGAVVDDHDLDHNPPYTHINFWGAVFRDTRNVTPANTEVQIANSTFWLLRDGATQWELFQGQTPPDLGGASFSPQYHGGSGDPILRHNSQGTFVVPYTGDIWHFWHGDGYEPSTNNIREMIVNTQARLVLRNANGVDDRSQAGYLIHMGADLRNPNDPGCALDNYICPSFGVGKFFIVTNEWRNMPFHSITQADMDAGMPMPPPGIFVLPGGTLPSSSSISISSSSSSSSSSSIPSPPVLASNIPRFNTAPTVDGSAENLWNSVPATSLSRVARGTAQAAADLSASWKAGWNNTGLFMLFEVMDNQSIAGNNASIWLDDGIEVYLDGGNQKATAFDSDDLMLRVRYGNNTLSELNNRTAGVQFAQSNTSTGYTVEMMVPWTLLGGTGALDRTIGFDVHVNDNDASARETKITWNDVTDNVWQNPSLLGNLRLQDNSAPVSVNPTYGKKHGVVPTSEYYDLSGNKLQAHELQGKVYIRKISYNGKIFESQLMQKVK